eukprot:g2457.t1
MMPSVALAAVLTAVFLAPAHATCDALKTGFNYDFSATNPSVCTAMNPTNGGPYCWKLACPTCGLKAQSPINIAGNTAAPASGLKPLEFEGEDINGGCTSLKIFNSGHSIEASLEGTNCKLGTTFNGTGYELTQFSLRSPSEHQIGGATLDGELQLLHSTTSGTVGTQVCSAAAPCYLAVAVLLQAAPKTWAKGIPSYTDNTFIARMLGRGYNEATGRNVTTVELGTKESADEATILNAFNADGGGINPFTQLLPPNPSYYTYPGSFTTPPCTEGVQWVVLSTPVTVGEGQMVSVREFMADVNGGRPNQGFEDVTSPVQYRNNRPTQPIYSRSVQFFNGAPEGGETEAHEENHDQWYTPILLPIGGVFSFVGVMVMVIGAIIAFINLVLLATTQVTGRSIPKAFCYDGKVSLATVRAQFAKAVILSLEVLVAADVIDTLAKPIEAQTFTQLGLISIIVVVRTVLALHLSHELHDIKHAKGHKVSHGPHGGGGVPLLAGSGVGSSSSASTKHHNPGVEVEMGGDTSGLHQRGSSHSGGGDGL